MHEGYKNDKKVYSKTINVVKISNKGMIDTKH